MHFQKVVESVEFDHVALGAEFRRRRKQEQLSLRAVAGWLKLSPPYISDLELGRRPWNEMRIKSYQCALMALGTKEDVKTILRAVKQQKPTGDFLIGKAI